MQTTAPAGKASSSTSLIRSAVHHCAATKKTGDSFSWFYPSDDCKIFLDDGSGTPCLKCSSPLRRFQRKDKQTGKQVKGTFAWFCTNDDCKTFLDDEKGTPVAPRNIRICHAANR